MDKQKTIYTTIGILLALAIVIIGYYGFKNHKKVSQQATNKQTQGQQVATNGTTPQPKNYNPKVPKNVKVPKKGEKVEDKDVAVPNIESQAAPGVETQFRKFTLSFKNDTLTPNKIIVYKGDTIHLDISATGKTYDLSIPAVYGISKTVIPGQKAIIEFQAYQTGQFDIVCKTCGNKKVGLLIVAPRK